MKKSILILAGLLCLITSVSFAQNFVQTVRGEIHDADGKFVLPGATVSITQNMKVVSVSADSEGRFRFDDTPVGRVSLKVSFMGYEDKILSNVEVTSGKEVVLQIELRESLTQMNDVVVKARKNKGDLNNEMSLISGRSVTVEETQRYAGSFNDPARMVSSFAGVTVNPEGNNDIVVRGNSPKYIQWRLEGMEIPNPNHFGDVGSSGGPISALNSNMLSNSDFYTGAFSPEYGDVLSGVFDVKFRNGNNEKREYTFGVGALGIETTLEGPFKKGYSGSYLFNYRYSTLALVDNLGLVDFGGVPKYQDAAFKVNLPTKHAGAFSFFGLGGKSSIEENYEFSNTYSVQSNEVFDYAGKGTFTLGNHLFTVGFNHVMPVTQKLLVETSLTYSGNGIRENEEVEHSGTILDLSGNFIRDSTTSRFTDYKSDLFDDSFRAGIKLSYKVNRRHKLELGSKYILSMNDFQTQHARSRSSELLTDIDLRKNMENHRAYLAWQFRLNEKVTLVSGAHQFYLPLTGEFSFEPRASARISLNKGATLSLGYGRHSRMEHISTYFARVEEVSGEISEPNKNLKLLKANHFVAGVERRFSENLLAKLEVYYQGLSDLPVSEAGTYYSSINETAGFYDVALVSKGTGKNFGVEFTLERFFAGNFYYLLSGSVYDSKYKTLDGVERNSAYNGNYAFNFLAGKEFVSLGRKRNKTIGINAKLFYVGARKIIPLLRDEQGNLTVNPDQNLYFDYSKAYERGLDNVFQVNASANLKINKAKTSHEFAIDIINANNTQVRLYEYYDRSVPGKVAYGRPLSILPNVIYRIHF